MAQLFLEKVVEPYNHQVASDNSKNLSKQATGSQFEQLLQQAGEILF